MPSADEFNAMMKGYDRLYGLEFLEISEEHVRARVLVRDELKQPLGLIHGGVYASLAESVTSLATAVVVVQEGNMATGMSNATNFLRPSPRATFMRWRSDCTGAARPGCGM